jgi:hypothetical protein
MSHGQTQTHKTPYGPNFRETTTFPLIVFSVPGHDASTQMSFCSELPSGSPEILKIKTSATLEAHNFVCRPLIEVSSKANLWPSSKAFQWYVAHHLHTNKSGKFPTLMASFGHNLHVKYSNGSCKPILDIYVPRAFQWYKELFNPMGFDPCNHSLKIRKSIGIPTFKVGAHLEVRRFIPSHSPTFSWTWDVTPGLHFWPIPLQALALVASPRLGLGHKATIYLCCWHVFKAQRLCGI